MEIEYSLYNDYFLNFTKLIRSENAKREGWGNPHPSLFILKFNSAILNRNNQ
jgi:hypothetical protein